MKLRKHPVKGFILMAAVAALVLTACGGNSTKASGSDVGSQAEETSGAEASAASASEAGNQSAASVSEGRNQSTASVSEAGNQSAASVSEGQNQPGQTDAKSDRSGQSKMVKSESAAKRNGRLATVSYRITYRGKKYTKKAYVYVPASYRKSKRMNILYLMHGSTGSGEQLANALKPQFDSRIRNGSMKPMLVVFPTYYPDSSFVVSDYSQDYPLNHFFATKEVKTLMKAVESKYHTYAKGTNAKGLSAGRKHRAFGGYSMGGVTTWDVLAYQSQYFSAYMPMAGDCWLEQVTDASNDREVSDLLTAGLKKNGYTSKDFRIIAMVGGDDGTKYSMQPQIEALRNYHSDLITDQNLLYWENKGGGHSQESLEIEVRHGIPYLLSNR